MRFTTSLLVTALLLLLCSGSAFADPQFYEADLFVDSPCDTTASATIEKAITNFMVIMIRARRPSISITVTCLSAEEWQQDVRQFNAIASIPFGAQAGYIVKVSYDGPAGSAKSVIASAQTSGVCRAIKYLCRNFKIAKPGQSIISGAVHNGDLSSPRLGNGGGGEPANLTITTVTGTGFKGSSPNGTPAKDALLSNPNGVAVDPSGNLYIADAPTHTIKVVRAADGKMYTFAGVDNKKGYAGDNGPASKALLSTPRSVAIDTDANGQVFVYIADSGNNRIRRVDATGTITIFAGSGVSGVGQRDVGDGKAAVAAKLTNPRFIAFDNTSVYWSDVDGFRVRRVDKATNTISTIAGTGVAGVGILGQPANKQPISQVRGVAVNPIDGSVHISDTGNNRVLKIDSNATLVRVAGTGVLGYDANITSAVDSRLSAPFGIAFDPAGVLYIADVDNNLVRFVKDGSIQLFAGNGQFGFSGDGGSPTAARLYNTQAIAIDTSLKLASTPLVYLADSSNVRIRVVNGLAETSSGR